ncbi:MAG: hypothetical protein CL677_00475 [Bdellovibrionaceae bacterium]|nr:hypothetical protein [Pseudobdellovibrionaceae bacterium]
MKSIGLLIGTFCLLLGTASQAVTLGDKITAKNILTEKNETLELGGKSGWVAVFLSAVCPCSNSHISEIRSLQKENPKFQFVGFHSNSSEFKKDAQDYFKNENLGFPVFKDTGAKWADQFKASKTPHVFVVQNDVIKYQGGVSNSASFEDADRQYLREALANLTSGAAVKTSRTRPLGCEISRGGSNDW